MNLQSSTLKRIRELLGQDRSHVCLSPSAGPDEPELGTRLLERVVDVRDSNRDAAAANDQDYVVETIELWDVPVGSFIQQR